MALEINETLQYREGNMMKYPLKKTGLKAAILLLAVGVVAACAVTPAEKSAEAKARAEQMLQTQVSLASQCSPQAASLMQEMPQANSLSPAEKKVFEAKYLSAVNNPVFQACYKMAWEDYREENAMQAEQMAAWEEADNAAWDNGFFFNGPFGWYY